MDVSGQHPSRALDEYWLRHCEGFQVRGASSRLGIVECLLFDPAGGVAGAVVLSGLLGTRRRFLPRERIAAVVPSEQSLTAAGAARLVAEEPAGVPGGAERAALEIGVGSPGEGRELITRLWRRGLRASLVERAASWRVEVRGERGEPGRLLAETASALVSELPETWRRLAIRQGARAYLLAPRPLMDGGFIGGGAA